MSDNTEVHSSRIPQLTEDNYSEWAMRFEARLIKKKLWSVINVERGEVTDDVTESMVEAAFQKALKARSKDKMAEARAEIIECVSSSQLAHLHSSDPRECWLELQRVHVARGLGTRMARRRQFRRLKKKDGESMSAWIGRVKELAFRLMEIGVNVDDEDKILALTCGLDDSYEPFIIALDGTPANLLNSELAIDRMLNEEMRRGNKGALDEEKPKEGKAEVIYVAQGGGGAGEQGGPRSCWKCGKVGHIQMYCREEPVQARKETVHYARHGPSGITDVTELRDLGTREVGHLL